MPKSVYPCNNVMLPGLRMPYLPRQNLAGVPQHVVERGNNCESITLTLLMGMGGLLIMALKILSQIQK
jgi:hypothetical protein